MNSVSAPVNLLSSSFYNHDHLSVVSVTEVRKYEHKQNAAPDMTASHYANVMFTVYHHKQNNFTFCLVLTHSILSTRTNQYVLCTSVDDVMQPSIRTMCVTVKGPGTK